MFSTFVSPARAAAGSNPTGTSATAAAGPRRRLGIEPSGALAEKAHIGFANFAPYSAEALENVSLDTLGVCVGCSLRRPS